MSGAAQPAFSKHGRIRARRSAVQALYQWDMAGGGIEDIISEFESDRAELKKADGRYFRDILNGVVRHRAELEAVLAPVSERAIRELDPVERAILYLGAYELMHQPEVPWPVVVNESVELAKMFGAEQSYRYINGVMDKLARRTRAEASGA
jgi:N utilization substance protein B